MSEAHWQTEKEQGEEEAEALQTQVWCTAVNIYLTTLVFGEEKSMIGSFWCRAVEDDFDYRSVGEEQSMINVMSTEKLKFH